MATQEQIDKLPAWAQNHIKKLTADLASKEAEVMALNGNADTLITYNNYVGEKRGLPSKEVVWFYATDADKKKGNYVEVEVRHGAIGIRASGMALVVLPRGGSQIAVKSTD